MRVMRYLMRHKAALVAVFALLLLMAFCELSLPTYTAAIVDNGVAMAAVGSGGDAGAGRARLGAGMLLGGMALGLVGCLTHLIPLCGVASITLFVGLFGGHGFDPAYLLAHLCSGGIVMGAVLSLIHI